MIDSYYRREDPDGQVIEVVPLTFGRARILVGDGHWVSDSW
jgi:hypothetical protein